MNVKDILDRADRLKSQRANFDSLWQKVADYVLPAREFTTTQMPGARRTQPSKIYNTMPRTAAKQLANALSYLLTPTQKPWLKLKASSSRHKPALDSYASAWGDDPVASWFEHAGSALFSVFNSPKAGFSTSINEAYKDIAVFGNGPLFVGDAGRHGAVFQSVPLAECYVTTDRNTKINGLFRVFKITAAQLGADWPNVQSKAVRHAIEKAPETKFEIIHAVYAKGRDERAPFDFHSVYVLRDGQEELERGGFHEFPYAFSRWDKWSGEDYGRGPAMDALEDILLLNKLEEVHLRAMSKAADPPMALPDDGFLGPVATHPGSLSYYRSGEQMKDRVFPLFAGVRPELSLEYIQYIEQRIRAAFGTEFLNLPLKSDMREVEVQARVQEQMRQLAPMVSRVEQELLSPIVERAFAVELRNGRLPPIPQELSGVEWEVEYTGTLSKVVRDGDAQSLRALMADLQVAATFDPRAVDVIDMPRAIRLQADYYGVPSTTLRTQEDADALAEAREQQAQQAQQVEGMQGIAAAAKDGAGAMRDLAGMQPQGMA